MTFPVEPAYNAAIEELRERQYPMLNDGVYLDHAASTPCSKALMDTFVADITSTLYGNPHSASWPSQLSASRIDDVRLELLHFFNADPATYDLVFVANATAGVKLIVEAMRSMPDGYAYAYHQACHTSLVGAREDARFSVCLDDSAVQSWLGGADVLDAAPPTSAHLFAFSAQSHMDGQRFPLSWSKSLHDRKQGASPCLYSLLDAASLAATSQLHLDAPDFAADFVVVSLYKIFGFPEIGAIMVRRDAESVFDRRRYFGGGTVDMVTCGKEQWHARKTQYLHERLEDGTLPFQSIMAAGAALSVHKHLFGSMTKVAAHTSYLAVRLRSRLGSLRHANGRPVCVLYDATAHHGERQLGSGPIVAFNLIDSTGKWVSLTEFEKLAVVEKMHVRTGGLCCPGGIASTLGLQPWELKNNLSSGYRCGFENDLAPGKPYGVIRVSFGAMSIASDVGKFAEFVRQFFAEDRPAPIREGPDPAAMASRSRNLRVKTITVYPIKSCGGFVVPRGTRWDVRAEGLAWDREWCLVHRGSGQALSQKRYPRMALLRPSLDLERGVMQVVFDGPSTMFNQAQCVEVSLSISQALFENGLSPVSSRVCGEKVVAQAYASDEINDFFTKALDVPCVLARFPAGGHGLGSRDCKARPQQHQRLAALPGCLVSVANLADMPSPPESDSEAQQSAKILLSNESPMLLVYSSSVDAVNDKITSRGGQAVTESAFRANVVVESMAEERGEPAYSEDDWSGIRIGDENFTLLGACRRCQMVCVDQSTAERRQEPLATLAKTRRFNGKVYFGAHMRHEAGSRGKSQSPTHAMPSIEVGDTVLVTYGKGTRALSEAPEQEDCDPRSEV